MMMEETKVKPKDEVTETKRSYRRAKSVYINPLTDFGFKRLFYNKELLIPFLNDVVGLDIKDIAYKPTEGLGWLSEERTALFDLHCTTNKNEHFVVEMQLGYQKNFTDRALFYGSHMIRKQAPRKKNWDFALKPVYIVSILNFNLFRDKASRTKVIERAYLYRESTKALFTDKLQLFFIQLPKFKKTSSELQDNTDTWLYLLKNMKVLKNCPPEIKGKPFKLFLEIAEIKHLTQEDMDRYAISLDRSYQMRNIAEYAEMRGEMKGIEKGIKKGRKEGIKEGSMAVKKQLAIRLLMRNMPIEDIISLTELSQDQVMALKSQYEKE